MKHELKTYEQAKADGFATYNRVPHLCVDIPNGNCTITCRTSEGKKITFAFLEYKDNEAPQCVDIERHETPLKVAWPPAADYLPDTLPTIAAIGFGPSGHVPDLRVTPEQGYSKLCVLLEDSWYHKVGVVKPETVGLAHRKPKR